MHALPEDRVRDVKLSFAVASDVQRLMVDIIAARGPHANKMRCKKSNTSRLTSEAPYGSTVQDDVCNDHITVSSASGNGVLSEVASSSETGESCSHEPSTGTASIDGWAS